MRVTMWVDSREIPGGAILWLQVDPEGSPGGPKNVPRARQEVPTAAPRRFHGGSMATKAPPNTHRFTRISTLRAFCALESQAESQILSPVLVTLISSMRVIMRVMLTLIASLLTGCQCALLIWVQAVPGQYLASPSLLPQTLES